MANKIKAKQALQLREAGVSANKIYAAHRISKKSQKEVLEAAANLGIAYADVADMLDAYLRWYRDVRLKSDLGYKSPMQYRRDLGLIA